MTNNYNENYLNVQVSDDIFWGFRMKIPKSDLYQIEPEKQKEYVCNYVKNELHNTLENLHLLNLTIKLKESRFHIHSRLNLLEVCDNEVVFVCGHC